MLTLGSLANSSKTDVNTSEDVLLLTADTSAIVTEMNINKQYAMLLIHIEHKLISV